MFLKRLRKLMQPFDMFCSSQLLRYNSNTEYKTLTGGLISFLIFITIVVGFTSMVSNTLNKSIINSKMITLKQSDPPLSFLTTSQEGMFMFAVGIKSINFHYDVNLSQTRRFFDVEMHTLSFGSGRPSQTLVELQQCTKNHWSMIPGFDKNFDSYGGSNWLCFPLNASLPLQGYIYSQVNSLLRMKVSPCRNKTINGTCASSEQISNLFQTYGSFSLSFNYVNPVVNTNLQQPISYYVQGNDYVIFSETIGSQAWLSFSDYQITSDSSIWPVADMEVKKGCIVQKKAINHPYSRTGNTSYATIFLTKSESTLIYTRQMQKISAVISYIGGLVGAITALLFLIKAYTDISLEITIGLKLFSESDKDEGGKEAYSFNLLAFVGLTVHRILKSLGWQGTWQFIQKLENLQTEAVKQLDVQLLLKRMIKLQTCMAKLLSGQELTEIKKEKFITIMNARKMRQLLLPSDQSGQHSDPPQTMGQSSLSDNASHAPSSIQMHKDQILTDGKLSPSFIEKNQRRIRSLKSHFLYQQGRRQPDREKTVSGLFYQQEASKQGEANLVRPLRLAQLRARNRIVPIVQHQSS